ncbi:MAG: hypothetical protein ACOH14_02265 [Rhodoglobus sp.]
MNHSLRGLTLTLTLAALLLGGIVASAVLGQLPVSPSEVGGSLLRSIGLAAAIVLARPFDLRQRVSKWR